MATADRKARARRTVDVTCGVIAELGLAGALLVWSRQAQDDVPFGPTASVVVVAASMVVVAGAVVVRICVHRLGAGAVLAASVGAWAVVSCLGVMVAMAMSGDDVLLWWHLFWTGGFVAALAVGLTSVWDRSRRERAGHGAA